MIEKAVEVLSERGVRVRFNGRASQSNGGCDQSGLLRAHPPPFDANLHLLFRKLRPATKVRNGFFIERVFEPRSPVAKKSNHPFFQAGSLDLLPVVVGDGEG